MLEIEHEKVENDTRAKDQKIRSLEGQASILNEKMIILKADFDESQIKGETVQTRLKLELKELTEELLVLKKRRNLMFVEDLQKPRIEDPSKSRRKTQGVLVPQQSENLQVKEALFVKTRSLKQSSRVFFKLIPRKF